jgi:hypothetical protein
MQNNKKTPINRNNLFFSEKDFRFLENLGGEYTEQVLNQTVVVYQIDRIMTNVDDLYGETKTNDIKYKTPVVLHCRYSIDQSQNKAYINSNNSGRYRQTGNIKIHVYDKTLKENECDIKYGDIIGVAIDENIFIYFEVLDDGKKNFANTQTMWGYKPLYRTIVGCELDENVFNNG